MAYDRSLHGSLREEVQELRKKVVTLETAEADNEKLRKELSKLKVSMQEDKSQMELDFMNQLTGVARENALKLEELEGRLAESNNVNRALGEQLRELPSPEQVEERFRATESVHKKEIAAVVDSSKKEMESMRKQLAAVQESRDQLSEKLETAQESLEMKELEMESLRQQEDTSTQNLRDRLNEANEESKKHKTNAESMEVELSKRSSLFENEMEILKERLKSRDSELGAKASEIRRLESLTNKFGQQGATQTRVLEGESRRLKQSLEKLDTEKKQLELSVLQLEREVNEGNRRYKQLNDEKEELTKALSNARTLKENDEKKVTERKSLEPTSSSTQCVDRAVNSVARTSIASPEFNAHEKRTTQIIRRLEQNLRKEGQAKQSLAAGLKAKKVSEGSPENTTVPSEESLQGNYDRCVAEIDDLKAQLRAEQENTLELRNELANVKATQAKSSAPKAQPATGRKPHLNLSTVSSPARDPKRSGRQSIEQAVRSPRTPVRGLVQSFEKQITKNSNKDSLDMLELDSYGVDELKVALCEERQHAYELEDELTRQCELSCTLLKEIASVTEESEVSRTKHAIAFGSESKGSEGGKEIERLSSELSKVKSQLAMAENSKLSLIKKNKESDRGEVERLTSEVARLKVELADAEKARASLSKLQLVSSSDMNEIRRLKADANEMQAKLDDAEQTVQRVRAEKDEELEVQKKVVQDLERRRRKDRRQSEEVESRASKMEEELAKMKKVAAEYETKKHEMAALESTVATMRSNLIDSEETKRALDKEKAAARRLDTLVQSLKDQLSETERKLEAATNELSKSRVEHEGRVKGMSSQIEGLELELKEVKEQRDDLEVRDKLHFEKFDSIRASIDEKVKEFEKIHTSDKEQISSLQEQVTSLETELNSALESAKSLQKKLQDKEEVEEAVEALQRQNQQSLDSQINKLQTELTKTQLAKSEVETDSEKRICSLEDMVDSIQAEMDETLQAKDAEIDTMKRNLGDKGSVVERLTKEKEQLVLSMKDMTSSRRNEIDELQSELMQMSTRAANQAREAQTLKVQLEESAYRKEEVERLRGRVRELTQQLASHGGSLSDQRTTELELENSDLRQKARETSLALKGAETKLSELMADKSGSSKTMQVLRERNAALKFEVEKLTKKLRKLSEQKQQNPVVSGTKAGAPTETVEAVRFMI